MIEEIFIQTSKEDIAKRFSIYNDLYFRGKLGQCLFSYIYMDGFGKFSYNPRLKGSVKSRILISKSVNWTENALKEIIIHEMIHMKIRTRFHIIIDGFLGHGILFMMECLRLRIFHNISIKNPPFHLQHLKKGPIPKIWERALLFFLDR